MKTLVMIASITVAMISVPVLAQNATYACQYIADAGLNWEKGQWSTSKFKIQRPFFLNSVNLNLTNESVGKALSVGTPGVFCHETLKDVQSCGDWLGGGLIFNFANLNGGVSQIYGASEPEKAPGKDSLHVRPFTCTKM